MEIIDKIIDSRHDHRQMLGDIRYIPTGTPKPIILFVHGFKGFKDWGHFNLIADWFAKNGFVYCKFNLSHNGTTPDHPMEIIDLEAFADNNFSIELDDLGSIIEAIKSPDFDVPEIEINKKDLFIIGHSRGGALAILKAAEDTRIKAIATWASICDLSNMWPMEIICQWEKDGVLYVVNSRTQQNMPLNYQLVIDYKKNKKRLDIPRAASKVKCPWLICHGTIDETIDISTAMELKSLNQDAELYVIDKASHTFDGGHPYNSSRLLKHARKLIGKTSDFFKDCI